VSPVKFSQTDIQQLYPKLTTRSSAVADRPRDASFH